MKKNNLNLRSEEVQELLTRPPHWMIRWGTFLIFGIMVLLLAFSRIIAYPDLIDADVFVSAVQSDKILLTGQTDARYFTKLKPGLKVNMRLDCYPTDEFGQITGILDSVSARADAGTLTLFITIPASHDKKKILLEGMSGKGDIVIEEVSLLDRLLRQIRF